MRFAHTADGCDLAIHDLSASIAGEERDHDAQAPPLLFAHANGFHGLLWRPVASRLRTPSRRFAFDFPGHGHSRAPDDHDYEWKGFGDDVLAVVDALALDRPIAIGHSVGGAAAVLAELARPGTFRALYLYEPIISRAHHIGANTNPLAQGALRRRERFASRSDARANYASKPPFNSFTAEALDLYVDEGFDELADGSVSLRCRPTTEAAVFSMSMHHGAFERLGKLELPVIVATGRDEGPASPAGWADGIVAAVPGAVLEHHPRLGHLGPMENPAEIASAIDAFIRNRVTPRS